MTNFAAPPPPPPSMSPGATTKAGPAGWVAVAAGVLGLLGLFLPWFTPKVTGNGASRSADTSFHAWNGFFFLIIAPVLLILAAVLWFQAMQGKHNSRFAGSNDPVRSLSLQSIAFGVVSFVLALLSFVILTATYKFKTETGNVSWSKASSLLKANGEKLERGPQIGLYLLMLGAVLLIVAGILGLIMKSASTTDASNSSSTPVGYPPAGPSSSGGFGGSPQGFGPPQQFDGPPSGPNPAGGPPSN